MTTRTAALQTLGEAFQSAYGGDPAYLAWAPGRVNLIGDHTDYNDGFVLPMAINLGTYLAYRDRPDGRVVVRSLNMGGVPEFELTKLARAEGWGEYVKGVAWSMREAGSSLRGLEGVVQGNVPVGSGLSSSAALAVASARALAQAAGLEWQPAQMARLAQRAEVEWVGVQCGIMDQLIATKGEAGQAMLIDCRSLETRGVRLPEAVSVVVLDTGTRRRLGTSAYNDRRAECLAAARELGQASLRDVSRGEMARAAGTLPVVLARRARHVVSENERVLAAARALDTSDVAEMGRLMAASHASLRDDFEVSSRELDLMVECAMGQAECLGARMTGAGFGGCAVALVEARRATAFAAKTLEEYRIGGGAEPAAYVVEPSAGAWVRPWREAD